MQVPAPTERQRIDKWLFFARVAKSRTIGGKLADAGHVRVNRDKIDQASHIIKIGDVLTIGLERRVLVLRVLDGGSRRGPAAEARRLYEDISPPEPPKADRPAIDGLREPGSGRPTKRNYRAIIRLKMHE